jgi:hypothetical protein
MARRVVILKTKGEDSRDFNRLVIEAATRTFRKEAAMAEQDEERKIVLDENAEPEDEVEAHIDVEIVADQVQEDRESFVDAPDFEAHRKSH